MTQTIMTKTYDVVICGAGLAGLTLARQLKLQRLDLSIALIDRLTRPLPEATFKIGEATTELGAYYLAEVLQLEDYLETHHLRKLGLRLFFGDPHGPFQNRPEAGVSEFLPPYAYSLDRGRIENDLRQLNLEAGVTMLENCRVKDIELAPGSQLEHRILYTQGEDKEMQVLKAYWVVDAMGRRRFLQKKLGLTKPNNERFSAVWFRVEGRVDVSDFVPPSEQAWHHRVPNGDRYWSTNHLCGEGYWIWLIALPSGYTSIGIVADGTVHPFSTYHTPEKAYQWLEKHEPILANCLKDRSLADFGKMPHYSYSSTQVFSDHRWACIGEAGTFPDPLYGTGTDQVGFANTLVTQLIERDFEGNLTQETVEQANLFYLTYNDGLAANIHNVYPCFGNGLITSMKVIWDTLAGWSFSGPMMFNALYLDPVARGRIRKGSGLFFILAQRMQKLFQDWSTKSLGRGSFDYLNYLELPFFKQVRLRNLQSKTEQELIDDHLASIELFEELAQVIFLLAVEDTMPEKLAEFPAPLWLNAWAISLNSEKWETDGLFRPKSSPRDLRPIREQLRRSIHFTSVVKQPVA